jgi:hypothetical protein
MEITVKGEYNAAAYITADEKNAVLEVSEGIVWTPSDLRKLAAALTGMAGILEKPRKRAVVKHTRAVSRSYIGDGPNNTRRELGLHYSASGFSIFWLTPAGCPVQSCTTCGASNPYGDITQVPSKSTVQELIKQARIIPERRSEPLPTRMTDSVV